MQYILTEDELALSTEKLQELCTKIANEMPIKFSWRLHETPEPLGCILNADSYDSSMGCCDECPVQSICPSEFKEWSK